MTGCLISVAVATPDLDRELDGLAQLGVQIIETDAAGAVYVQEHSDLIAFPDDPPYLLRFGPAATPADLIDRTRELPDGAVFFASGAGPSALPITLTALATGGHLRTGVADCPEYAPGEPTRNAVQLAARLVGLAKIAQRPPLTIAEARDLLGVVRA
ncbi:MAG TPA: 3-keto-5-aminohexanoate cleavage protein [Mycobacteriales bacterium]|nr:3-keto-5-aminohexanoate cleavage protein [Mycobacteriales bacterium]